MNDDILKNNVSTNQTFTDFKIEGFPVNEAKTKILFLGNSITRHEVKEEIGWFNEWGMAASSIENDYVHQTINLLDQRFKPVSFVTYNCAKYEKDYINIEKMDELIKKVEDYKPDIIVFRIGENFNKEYLNNQELNPYQFLLRLLLKLKMITYKTLMTSLFWKHDVIENGLRKAADVLEIPYIVINDLGDDDKYKAIGLFEHYGVAHHPGDLGMKEIAVRISKFINSNF